MSEQTSLTCPACRKISAAQNYNPAARYSCPNCGAAMVVSAKAPSAQPPAPEAPPAEVAQAMSETENRVGRYVLVTVLGKGAMGQVWRGWDSSLKRWVAVKVMRFQDVSPEDLARFRREAKTAAALDHPNIAPVYDLGEVTGRHYIVMKLIEGSTLEEKFRMPAGQPTEISAVVDAIRQASRGLAHAHARGIIHRDVKPANMMRDQDGRVYLMDFGLAKPISVPGVTGIGGIVIMGTPSFMSPEAARGMVQMVDARSDVFSLGASLYFLLTGRVIFPAPGGVEMLRRAQSETVPRVRTLRADVPAEIEEIIVRATARERSERFQNAAAFADALDLASGAAAAPAVSSPPAGPARALVVDDDPQVLALFVSLIQSLGLHAVPCRDAATAEAEAKKGPVALVVLDEGLPDTSGLKLIKRLRALPGHEKIPVLMVTGMGGADNAARALETGADEFMSKPVSPREFKARAMKLIRR
ncbi:MAG: serine/threonine protein kinase [Planctomycetota bacterium]|nr:MAG: serine/threonine protein kinase [Planctomycetota bacterium]